MGKIIFITGANRGIGLETARQLSEKGCHVLMGCRNAAEGEKSLKKIKNSKAGKLEVVAIDVTDDKSIQNAAGKVEKIAGRLDVLINNAGIFPDGKTTIAEMDRKLALTAFETNTLGPVRVTQAFLPLLRNSKEARVINLSSGLGALGKMKSYAPSYSISKTALNAVTRQFSDILAKEGMAVNAMCPGWVRTDMGGPHAERDVHQGADTVVWLALQAPQKLTGKFLRDRKEIKW